MLMYYELLNPAVTSSWVAHLQGTAELLLLRGPQNCQTGASHLLFRSIRLLMAHASLRTQNTSCFASPEWSDVPFARSKKTAIDTLLDAIHKASILLRQHDIEKYGDSVVEPQETLLSQSQKFADDVIYSEELYAKETPEISPTKRIENMDDRVWLCGGDFCSTMPSVMHHATCVISHRLQLLRVHKDRVVDESRTRCSSILEFAYGLFQRNL
ncbi:hypothetical protein BDV27DRAFT_124842 [Aspergillus caelatus]|uniref:Uncharacterized protein n=1 Tax=Aspergillus caelatus TaxID=61420 RepID=A0A5N7ACP1_9EURO|nr:uncharacterized protein BDV27DRAFT_124842 [Aspergillus caelatus]KAE8366829.1 hypothetical protein BDV27DRAFT_124842 [Aspergillus caelatus]